MSGGHDGAELVSADWRLRLPRAAVSGLVIAGRLAAISTTGDDAVVIDVVYLPTQRVVATLTLEGAQRAAVRIADLCLVVGDDRGRLIVVDLRSGAVRRDLRVT